VDPTGWFISRHFYGADADVAIASLLFSTLLDVVRRRTRAQFGGGWSPSHQDYARGFAYRLHDRVSKKWKPEQSLTGDQCNALMVIEKEKEGQINKWQEQHHPFSKRKPKDHRKIKDEDAWAQGFVDAADVDLGDPRRRL
jgi:hypothetical protein